MDHTLPTDFFSDDATPEVKELFTNAEVVKQVMLYNKGLLDKRSEVLGKLAAKEAILKELGDVEQVKTKLSQYGKFMQERAELEARASQNNSSVEDVRTSMQKLIEDRDLRLQQISDKRVSAERKNALKQAMRDAGVDDPELLLPHVDARVKTTLNAAEDVVFELFTSDGKPLLKDNGDPATLKELMAEIKLAARFAPFFKADNIGGTGGRNGGGGNSVVDNPFLKKSPNYSVTNQTNLYRSNRELAIKLARQAGVALA